MDYSDYMAAMLRRAFERSFPGANKPQIKPISDEEIEKAVNEAIEKMPDDGEKREATPESEFFDKLFEQHKRQER